MDCWEEYEIDCFLCHKTFHPATDIYQSGVFVCINCKEDYMEKHKLWRHLRDPPDFKDVWGEGYHPWDFDHIGYIFSEKYLMKQRSRWFECKNGILTVPKNTFSFITYLDRTLAFIPIDKTENTTIEYKTDRDWEYVCVNGYLFKNRQ